MKGNGTMKHGYEGRKRDMFDMMSCCFLFFFFPLCRGVTTGRGEFSEKGSPFWGLMVDASAGTRRGLLFLFFVSIGRFSCFFDIVGSPLYWGTSSLSLTTSLISLLGLSCYSILEPWFSLSFCLSHLLVKGGGALATTLTPRSAGLQVSTASLFLLYVGQSLFVGVLHSPVNEFKFITKFEGGSMRANVGYLGYLRRGAWSVEGG